MTGTSFAAPLIVTNNTNNVTFTDASTDVDGNIASVTVVWGDGSVSTGNAGDPFSHSYTRSGRFMIAHSVKDAAGVVRVERAFVKIVPPVYTISGTVTDNAGNPLSGAMVYLKLGGHTRSIARSAANGTFTLNRVLPGTYSINTYKRGYTFNALSPVAVTGIISGQTIAAQ